MRLSYGLWVAETICDMPWAKRGQKTQSQNPTFYMHFIQLKKFLKKIDPMIYMDSFQRSFI